VRKVELVGGDGGKREEPIVDLQHVAGAAGLPDKKGQKVGTLLRVTKVTLHKSGAV
jgi:hypothetical protein